MHVDFGENRFLFLIIHAINWVVKIKSPFYQGIESASSPGLYSLDVQYFGGTVFPRELGPGGGPYSLREYGPPDRKLGRTVYPMTPDHFWQPKLDPVGSILAAKSDPPLPNVIRVQILKENTLI